MAGIIQGQRFRVTLTLPFTVEIPPQVPVKDRQQHALAFIQQAVTISIAAASAVGPMNFAVQEETPEMLAAEARAMHDAGMALAQGAPLTIQKGGKS